VVYSLSENQWKDNVTIQLQVKDFNTLQFPHKLFKLLHIFATGNF